MGIRFIRLLILLGLVSSVLVFPSVSSAGLYEVSACTESVGYLNNSWHLFDSDTHYLEANSACDEVPTHELSPKLSNLSVGDVLGVGDPPIGVEAGWRFTAPIGTTISEVRGSDDLFKNANNDWAVHLSDSGGHTLGGQTCTVELESSLYCEVSGVFQESGIDTSSVALGVLCTENSSHNCPDGATIHDVRAELDYATVTINDPITPTSVTGASLPSGPQHGTVAILGSAADDAAGLLSLSVVNGSGEVVGGPVAAPIACDYSFVTPCQKEVEDLSIPVDTTKFPNGQDQIRVEATNAAHDEGLSIPYTITVQNEAPTSGGPGGSGEEGSVGQGGTGHSAGSSGGQSTVSGTSGGSSTPTTTGVLTTKPVSVLIHLNKLERVRSELVIEGNLSPAAPGSVALTIQVAKRHRTVKLDVVNGRFHAKVRLSRGDRERRLRLRVLYPGATGFLSADRTQVLRPLPKA